MNKLNSIKISIFLTTAALVVLIGFAAMLPWLVTWYVQLSGRNETLATTIMATCYPCAPFTAVILLSLRKILKNIRDNCFNKEKDTKLLKYMSISCLIISVITLISGKHYLPFFIVAATFLFLAIIIFAFKSITDKLFIDK